MVAITLMRMLDIVDNEVEEAPGPDRRSNEDFLSTQRTHRLRVSLPLNPHIRASRFPVWRWLPARLSMPVPRELKPMPSERASTVLDHFFGANE